MVLFRVDDMTCGCCTGTLARALAEADKGARVEFDVQQRLVRVQPQAASVVELQEAMEEAGYHPVITAELHAGNQEATHATQVIGGP